MKDVMDLSHDVSAHPLDTLENFDTYRETASKADFWNSKKAPPATYSVNRSDMGVRANGMSSGMPPQLPQQYLQQPRITPQQERQLHQLRLQQHQQLARQHNFDRRSLGAHVQGPNGTGSFPLKR